MLNTDYVFLVEKEAIWAEMLIQVLMDNRIACTAIPVHGAGLVLSTGMQERLNIYVPEEKQPEAEELLNELFPEKCDEAESFI